MSTSTDGTLRSDPSTPLKHKLFSLSVIFLILAAISSVVLLSTTNLAATHSTFSANEDSSSKTPTKPDAKKYQQLKSLMEVKRLELAKKYTAGNATQKSAVIKEARSYLETTMPQMMHCWIGTPWDFNGTSQTPGEGKIACGYFVSVVLRDAGFKVSRISLAQQPSQRIITTMIKSSEKKVIKYKKDYADFIEEFKKRADGIYVIGLDSHVGFLTNFNNEVHFIHSGASGVIDEIPKDARDVKISKYRVIGNISEKDYVVKKWLNGDAFPTNKG